jgi:TM2 domain-containing membrane protein YozV
MEKQMECPYCKEDILDGAIKCKHCDSVLTSDGGMSRPSSSKSKTVAGVLALLLGHIGIHKFYMGSWGWGIIYILFVLTFIPMVIALIEAIRYFTMSQEEFDIKASDLNGPFSFLW